MSTRALFIGEEADAAGFRLAGLEVRVPERGAEASALAATRTHAGLVLVASGVAARIPEAQLRSAIAALSPVTVVVPDVIGETALPDVAARLRRGLGLEG